MINYNLHSEFNNNNNNFQAWNIEIKWFENIAQNSPQFLIIIIIIILFLTFYIYINVDNILNYLTTFQK